MQAAKLNGSAGLEMDLTKEIHDLTRASDGFRRAETADGEMSGNHLSTLLRRVSEASMGELENLIAELHEVRKKLQTDGSRIQREISEYSELSQGVMQLATIISDSVKNISGTASSISP
jgi:hypothetical protein